MAFLIAFGGVALFIFGLKLISGISDVLSFGKQRKTLQNLLKPTLGAYFTGMGVAGLSQSSAIVSVLAVEFVEKEIISLRSSFAIIMGANVGTTVTAQLVSLSGLSGGVIGALASIIGLLMGLSGNSKVKSMGSSLLGVGVLFAGLSTLSSSISLISQNEFVKRFFQIENPLVLFLNGVILTALVQSSSAITGVMVMLAKVGLVSFKSSVYLTLGSNVGSCFIVVLLSLNKNVNARRTAYFNLIFNFLGSVIFFPLFCVLGDNLTVLFLRRQTVSRAIANFHTFFNLICSVIFLPFLNLFEKLTLIRPKERKNLLKSS